MGGEAPVHPDGSGGGGVTAPRNASQAERQRASRAARIQAAAARQAAQAPVAAAAPVVEAYYPEVAAATFVTTAQHSLHSRNPSGAAAEAEDLPVAFPHVRMRVDMVTRDNFDPVGVGDGSTGTPRPG